MALILAVEPNRSQAALLKGVVSGPQRIADLVIETSAERALKALGGRVPDLVLASPLLSWHDESLLGDRLRQMGDAAAHVQTLTIPILASPKPTGGAGVLSKLRRQRPSPATPDGCDPAIFADEIRLYLERAGEKRDRVVTAPAAKPESIVAAPVSEAAASEPQHDSQDAADEPFILEFLAQDPVDDQRDPYADAVEPASETMPVAAAEFEPVPVAEDSQVAAAEVSEPETAAGVPMVAADVTTLATDLPAIASGELDDPAMSTMDLSAAAPAEVEQTVLPAMDFSMFAAADLGQSTTMALDLPVMATTDLEQSRVPAVDFAAIAPVDLEHPVVQAVDFSAVVTAELNETSIADVHYGLTQAEEYEPVLPAFTETALHPIVDAPQAIEPWMALPADEFAEVHAEAEPQTAEEPVAPSLPSLPAQTQAREDVAEEPSTRAAGDVWVIEEIAETAESLTPIMVTPAPSSAPGTPGPADFVTLQLVPREPVVVEMPPPDRRKFARPPMKPVKRPAQDEWGLFDPAQCGFAALVAELDDVTDAPNPGTSVRVIGY